MSKGNQNFGFDPDDPVIIGKTATIVVFVADLTAAEVTSADWRLFDRTPAEGAISPLVTKSTGGSGVTFTIALDPADTLDPELEGSDYFHRIDYVHTDGSDLEAARGMGRLTPRA
jgi:hypothetical protein